MVCMELPTCGLKTFLSVKTQKILLNGQSSRGVGTGPATAGPMFPEPTIRNIIPLFVFKQIKNFILQLHVYTILIKELHYNIIERTRYLSSSSNNFVTN